MYPRMEFALLAARKFVNDCQCRIDQSYKAKNWWDDDALPVPRRRTMYFYQDLVQILENLQSI